MLSIELMEEFEQYFAKMVPLAEAIGQACYLPEEKAGTYLAGLVSLSEKHRLPFAADLALLKAQLYQYTPELGDKENGGSQYERKRKKQFLLHSLKEAKAYADDYFAETRRLIAESCVLLRKVATVACAKGFEAEGDMEYLIAQIKQDPELLPALTSAVGTIGFSNMRRLLQRAIVEVSEEDFE